MPCGCAPAISHVFARGYYSDLAYITAGSLPIRPSAAAMGTVIDGCRVRARALAESDRALYQNELRMCMFYVLTGVCAPAGKHARR